MGQSCFHITTYYICSCYSKAGGNIQYFTELLACLVTQPFLSYTGKKNHLYIPLPKIRTKQDKEKLFIFVVLMLFLSLVRFSEVVVFTPQHNNIYSTSRLSH